MNSFSSLPLVSIEIPRSLHEKRFDVALVELFQKQFPDQPIPSRTQGSEWIKEGKIVLNGKVVTAKTIVSSHDIVTFPVDILAKKSHNFITLPVPEIPVLFENSDFLVIEKPAGIEVHQSNTHPKPTVTAWLGQRYPDIVNVGEDPLRPGIVHRLDRDTSGLLIIAKHQKSFEELKKAFQERRVKKTYAALLYGHLTQLEGEVKASLIRRPGELKRRAVDPETASETLPGNVRTALTSYRVLTRYEEYDLVQVMPETGRTHQIRVHMAFLGHPVVGDRLYAFRDVKRKKLLFPKRQLLHAASLSFSLFGETYQFSSSLPQDFRAVLMGVDETLISSYDDEALKSLF